MGEDYYRILEVGRDASQDDIRRAYRRLALRLHPDKNPQCREAAEARFKVVSEAYEVLSNEEKRRKYDRYGSSAFNAPPPAESPPSQLSGGAYAFTFRDPEEVFKEFFGTEGPFQDLFGSSDQGAPRTRGSTILTGGTPFWKQSFGSADRSGFLFNMDDVLFATHVPAGMGVAPGFVGMPTQQMSSAWYEGGKRVETRTTIEESGKMVLRLEDGVPVSRAINGVVQTLYESSEETRYSTQGTRQPTDAGTLPTSANDRATTKRPSLTRVTRPPPPPVGIARRSESKPGAPTKPPPMPRASGKGGKGRGHPSRAGSSGKEVAKTPRPTKKDGPPDGTPGPSASAAAAPQKPKQLK